MAETCSDGHRLIFIGGSPRSGTTLLQNMLDSHPLILGGPEFLHLPDIIELRRKLHYSIGREWISLFCTRDEVDRHLISVISKLFLSLSDKYHCEFYSEKTPENILVFSELIELFPEAHFIQVIRDPRAILSSMRQVKKRAIERGINQPAFVSNTSKSIAYMKNCFDAGFKADSQAPGKVLTVIYEQLIEAPEREAKRICRYIGVEFNNKMLHPGQKEHLGSQAITKNSNEIWYNSKTYSQNIVAPNKEKWKKELPLRQQLRATVAFMDSRELRQYGYDFSVDSLVHRNRIFLRSFVYGLFLVRNVYKSMGSEFKKFPGRSFIKNVLLAVSSFFRTKV